MKHREGGVQCYLAAGAPPSAQSHSGEQGPAWLVWGATSHRQILLGLKWGMEEFLGPLTSLQALPALQPLVPV